MDRLVIGGHRGLLEALAERRLMKICVRVMNMTEKFGKTYVRVACPCDVLSAGTVLNRKDTLSNHLTSVRPYTHYYQKTASPHKKSDVPMM